MKLYVTDELKRFENGLVFAWESLLKNIMGYYYLDDLTCITNGKQNVIVEDSITGIKETFSRLNGLENTYIDLLNKRNDFEIKDHLNAMNNITFDCNRQFSCIVNVNKCVLTIKFTLTI